MITAITSNRVVLPDGVRKATVIIREGKIVEITDGLPAGDTAVTDLGDLVLMPGIIDPHVHINEPGRSEWEGFDTASRAAIAGGVTTLVDMPLNASPVTTTGKAFDEKISSTNGKLHCNCGFWGGVVPGNEKEIPVLIEKGVLGFKAFLTHSGIDEFPNVTEADLRKVMPVISESGLPLLVHCELENGEQKKFSGDTRSYQNYLSSRPESWEVHAIDLVIRLCAEFNCRTHIVHLSAASALPLIRAAKDKQLPLTAETAQHYLYFSSDDIPDGQTAYKCAPPVRNSRNQALLWKALKEGIIDFVATDHSPAPPAMKDPAQGDLLRAWGGIASLQFALPALWTAARNYECKPEAMAKWLCENPAQLPGLARTKGKIGRGYDADLVAWDPESSFVLNKEDILHRHKITPYLGERLYGKVAQSWLAGEKTFAEGKILHLNKGRILYHGHS